MKQYDTITVYDTMTVAELKTLAKEIGVKLVSGMKKQDIIDALKSAEQNGRTAKEEKKSSLDMAIKKAESKKTESKHQNEKIESGYEKTKEEAAEKKETGKFASASDDRKHTLAAEKQTVQKQKTEIQQKITEHNTENRGRNEHSDFHKDRNNQRQNNSGNDGKDNTLEMQQLDSGETKTGILEVLQDGYGFIRCDNFLPGENDVYVSPAQIRRFNLKTGDIVEGNTRIRNQNEKFSALLYVNSVNGFKPSEAQKRKKFEDLTPIFPNKRIHLETDNSSVGMRMVDLISPIGRGQRGMIVSPPKAGKTTLLKQIAKAITKNHPDMHLIILLIDERPEEVTDIKESIEGKNVEVIYSTFDELPENHKRVSEMVIERGRRLVEHKQDVVILLDSITRLARAYNLTVQASGRTLSGGLDPAALHMPKKFFGAARNMREGGSLTILATALVETGSRMDDVVFEEFKGTGNMEVVLDRSLSEKRIFPAIDLLKSSTRRDDLLLNPEEKEVIEKIRKALNGMRSEDALEHIIEMFKKTKNNKEFIETMKKTKL